MDYSKVKFVTPSVSATDITKGKVYPVLNSSESGFMEIKDDVGFRIGLFAPECLHLDGKHWTPCHEDGTPLNQSDNPALHKTSVTHSMSGEGMNSLEFFDMIKKEWCKSEEQYKPFWHDVLTFARKYHKERKEYGWLTGIFFRRQ